MIIQDQFNLSKDFLEFAKGDYFPWYYQPISCSEKFPAMSHACIRRGEGGESAVSNSRVWDEAVKPAFFDFCNRNNLKVREVLRCALNLTFASSGQYVSGDKHVDQEQDHMVLIAYINDDCSGDTIIYDKKWSKGDPATIYLEVDPGSDPEKLRVSPKENTAVCFDGGYYHANTFPQLGERRIVCVINFTVDK